MGRDIGETVETPAAPALVVRLLGPISVVRRGVEAPLPRSRKVRGLLGFLALSPQSVSRTRLCDLFWDVPNDPRGELRWSLSKLRGFLDDANRARVTTRGDLVGLDLADTRVDALQVDRALQAGLDGLAASRLAEVCDLIGGV